jgi:hypothetical protein
MADEIANRTEMILHGLGERQRTAHQTRDPLTERVIKSLDVVGFPDVLTDGCVLRSRDDPSVGRIVVRIEYRPFTIHLWNVGPELFGAVTAAIPDVESNDLARLPVYGNPHPLRVGLLLHKTVLSQILDEGEKNYHFMLFMQPRHRTVPPAFAAHSPSLSFGLCESHA